MKYIFSNNTDYKKRIEFTSKKGLEDFLNKYHRIGVSHKNWGNLYGESIFDEKGDRYFCKFTKKGFHRIITEDEYYHGVKK